MRCVQTKLDASALTHNTRNVNFVGHDFIAQKVGIPHTDRANRKARRATRLLAPPWELGRKR